MWENLHLFLLVFNNLSIHDKLWGCVCFRVKKCSSLSHIPNLHISLPPNFFHDCVPLPIAVEGEREKQASIRCMRQVSNTERTVEFHSHYS